MERDEQILQLASIVDRFSTRSRLAELSMFMTVGPHQRISSIGESLEKLRPGPYLLGCGPYCCDLMRVTVDCITIGRTATPEEHHADAVADILVNDTPWLKPREVSRIHASVLREGQGDDAQFLLKDEGSTTGTYLNGRQLVNVPENDQVSNPANLDSGDIIALGSSGINSFIFFTL